MILLSTFENVRDNEPGYLEFETWGEFVEWLRDHSTIESPATKEAKEGTFCISPALYEPGKRRAKSNVLAWTWFAADIDNKAENEPGHTINDVASLCIETNVPFVIYTTTSSQSTSESFRLMVPVSRVIDPEEFAAFWHSMSRWLGCLDEQTKDPSRLFIAPRTWDGADNEFIVSEAGEPLDVDAMLAAFPPPPPPTMVAISEFARVWGKTVEYHHLELDGPFVSPGALAKAQSAIPGGRMFAFLVSVGTRAMLKGYAITPDDLQTIGRRLAASIGREVGDIAHDARSAYQSACQHSAGAQAERFTKLSPHQAYLDKWVVR